MMTRKTALMTIVVALLLLLAACGGEDNAPLSTGEQGGQVAAPDAVNEDAAATSAANVQPGDAETIGDTTGNPGNTTTGGDAVSEGATPEAGNAADPGAMAAPAFLNDWSSAGATVSTGGQVPASLFEGASGQSYTVNDAEVQVYEFQDAAAAEPAAGTISADGGMINDVSVRWAGSPHFYRQDNWIVVYIGDDAATLDMLNGSLGQAFAGTP